MVNGTPLLRFFGPFSARPPRRACAGSCQLAGCPASTVRRGRHLLRPDASQHRAPTHGRRRLVLAVFVLALGQSWPGRDCADRRRAFWPGRFAFPRRAHRCIDSRASRPLRVMRRRLSAAGVPLPARRVTWPGRSPFGGEAFLGFRPVNVSDRDGPASGVTRVTVSLSTPCPDGAPGVPRVPSQACSRGRVRVAFPRPRTHVPFADVPVAVF